MPNLITVLFLCVDSIAITIALGIAINLQRPVTMYFHEEAYITQLSFVQLLIASGIAWLVFKVKTDRLNLKSLRSPSVFWLITAIGFMFLAIDEIWQLHEELMQSAIFAAFNLKKNFITLRINDLIVLLYGFLGVMIVYFYLPEINQNQNHRTLQHLLIGFVLLFATVTLDTLSNRREIPLVAQLLPVATNVTLRQNFKVIEEAFKLFSEAFFIGAFYSALQETLALRHTKHDQEHKR